MTLTDVNSTHLNELINWIDTANQLKTWAGPNMTYPCDTQTLERELLSKDWPSFSLISTNDELVGFGQYYVRLGHCHLCRLIVAPSHRGKRLAQTLIELISLEARQALGITSCSLFVYTHNSAAIKAYEKIGFRISDYPSDGIMENCLYMLKS